MNLEIAIALLFAAAAVIPGQEAEGRGRGEETILVEMVGVLGPRALLSALEVSR